MPNRDGSTERAPDEWKSGGDPMTESQASFLKRLSDQAGEAFDPSLSKAAASKKIDELLARGKGETRSRTTRRSSRPAPKRETIGGEDPMTEAQSAYLKELAEEEGGDFDPDLTKTEAARRIGELLIKQMARVNPTEPSRR
jgi:hypothetical protein